MKLPLPLYAVACLFSASAAFAQTPVLVELFTSEGCSSCPPADAVLAELDRKSPAPGAQVIVLSEHVDYWDRLGWKDPFSAAQFSQRQEWYAAALGEHTVYTPQMVVDGKRVFVGSDRSQARLAINQALTEPKLPLHITVHNGLAQINAEIDSTGGAVPKHAELWLAVSENNLKTAVARGENSGRTLPHTGVVRQLKNLGAVSQAQVKLALDPLWKRVDLHAIAFLQDTQTRRILGVATAPVD